MKNKIFKVVALILTAGLIFTSVPKAFAVLGPVHVELNISTDHPSGVRAGQVTAFKIHIRLNATINVHDAIKIWFPIDELSCDPKDFCDWGPMITGGKESPRFIPNDAYFTKYQNKDEAIVGKLYEVLEDRKGLTRFDKCECAPNSKPFSPCGEGNCRIIADPSGFGCWILGTVLPALPRDEADRWQRLAQIIHTTSIGITPCTECQGLPFLINTVKERSYQVNSPLAVEPWRKGYNPIDFNTSKATGILAPMSPGRYRLLINTSAENTPVESEAFALPCSEISKPTVSLKPSDTDTPTDMTVKFVTGEGGALDADSSNIMIQFPTDYVLPNSIKNRTITVNGIPLNKAPQIVKNLNQVTITSPTSINSLQEVTIVFTEKTGIKNPPKVSEYTLKVKTESEPELIESSSFKVITVPFVDVTPNFERFPAQYNAVGLFPEGVIIKKGQEFSVLFPKGTQIPNTIAPSSIEISRTPYQGPVTSTADSVLLAAPSDIKGALKIKFLSSAGIRNTNPGSYDLKFSTGGQTYTFEKYEIIKSKPLVSMAEALEEQGCEPSAYKLHYIPSVIGELSPGDKITIEFPEGTILPKFIDPSQIIAGGKPVSSVSIEGMSISFVIDANIKPIEGADIELKVGAGIVNPRYPGAYKLKVWSNKDEATQSPDYVITMPKLISEAHFKDPDQPDGNEFDGCVWFKTAPILSMSSCNPYAKLLFWYDNKSDQIVPFSNDQRFGGGQLRTTIHYYAQIGDEKEQPKSLRLCLDTVAPAIEIIEPSKDVSITNKKTFVVKGSRTPQEMLTDGDNVKYQVADGVKVNGESVLEPVIFETLKRDEIQLDWAYTVNLNEGENKIEILGFDEAGNLLPRTKTIILDTKPPVIEYETPKPGETVVAGERISIKVMTESTATVSINGSIADKADEYPDGKASFELIDYIVKEGENTIEISATDVIGNSSPIMKLKFIGKKKQTIIELWIGKKEYTVNGEKKTMISPPVTSSPPLPKNFAGNTYMPIRPVAEALNAEPTYDPKTKMVTITQKLDGEKTRIIKLWVNKKTANIDGKDVPIDKGGKLYPVNIGGSVLLPLRFVAEALGTQTPGWVAKEKKITLVYPKL